MAKKLTKLSEIQKYVKDWIEKVGEKDWTKWNYYNCIKPNTASFHAGG